MMLSKFKAWETALWSDAPALRAALTSKDPEAALDKWARRCDCVYGGKLTRVQPRFAVFDGVAPPTEGLPHHPAARSEWTLQELLAERLYHEGAYKLLLGDIRNATLRARLDASLAADVLAGRRASLEVSLGDRRQLVRVRDGEGRLRAVEREIRRRGGEASERTWLFGNV